MTKKQKEQRNKTLLLIALAGLGLYLVTRAKGVAIEAPAAQPLVNDPNATKIEPQNVPELSTLPMVPGPIPYIPQTDPVYLPDKINYNQPELSTIQADYYYSSGAGGGKQLIVSPYNGQLVYADGYGPDYANQM